MRCFVKQTRHQPSTIGLLFGERLPCKWVIIVNVSCKLGKLWDRKTIKEEEDDKVKL